MLWLWQWRWGGATSRIARKCWISSWRMTCLTCFTLKRVLMKSRESKGHVSWSLKMTSTRLSTWTRPSLAALGFHLHHPHHPSEILLYITRLGKCNNKSIHSVFYFDIHIIYSANFKGEAHQLICKILEAGKLM